jgi:hypothetical protein
VSVISLSLSLSLSLSTRNVFKLVSLPNKPFTGKLSQGPAAAGLVLAVVLATAVSTAYVPQITARTTMSVLFTAPPK